ncbi:MAG TPA: ribonuclease III [Balneolaceae bacterium]|nr:ribonuclease III [Balneolaceae bacterium]|tara:strand:+ start:41042 stop:41785 length:744 start_codon:yes stop_codon:yes gene_type:complete
MLKRLRSIFTAKNGKLQDRSERILKLEKLIGVTIEDPALFKRALRHRSMVSQEKYAAYDSYERLEFLGDAVLDLIAAEILFNKYPEKNEGFLTKIRAKLVRGESLAKYTQYLGFEDLMEVGEKNGNMKMSKSILADVFESIVAAIYITYGYQASFNFVKNVFDNYVDYDDLVHTVDNYKSALLEYTQAERLPLPRYKLISESGPGHNRTFEVKVLIGEDELGTGVGKSKKKAEQLAAEVALQSLDRN